MANMLHTEKTLKPATLLPTALSYAVVESTDYINSTNSMPQIGFTILS
jgi:hypothetical protein